MRNMFVLGNICLFEIGNSRYKSLVNVDAFSFISVDYSSSHIQCLNQTPQHNLWRAFNLLRKLRIHSQAP